MALMDYIRIVTPRASERCRCGHVFSEHMDYSTVPESRCTHHDMTDFDGWKRFIRCQCNISRDELEFGFKP